MKSIIIFLITVIVVALSAVYPHLMLNPGELIEEHQKIKNDCAACHKPFWGIESGRCSSCHKVDEIGMNDSTEKNSAQNRDVVLFHSKLKNQECVSCHSDHKGIHPQFSISRFDHELLSADMKTNCNSCHGRPADKLHNQLSVSCNNCHNTTGWKFSGSFNHNLITGVNKSNCTACHQKPTDSFHQLLQSSCDKCHTTSKWSPSTFDHAPYFILDKDHNAKCSTCHSGNNFSAYTCYGCHEHSESKIAGEHHEEGIYNFTDCASCHKSGDEHDIRMNNENRQNIDSKDINNMKKYIKSQKKEDSERDKDDD